MMKKTKFIVSCLLAIIAAISLFGCGKDKNKNAVGTTDYNFSVSAYELILDKGDTHAFRAVYGSYEMTYKSSDETVVTVDSDGTIHAKAAGIAYVTASANGKEQSCKVVVEDPVYALTIDKTSVVSDFGATVYFKATAVRDGKTLTDADLKWEVDGSDAKLTESGSKTAFTASKEGLYKITVTDEKGNTAAATVKVMKSTATALAAPVLTVDGKVVSWTAVEGATEYYVGLGDGCFEKANGTSYQAAGENVKVYVYASAGESNFDFYDSETASINVA